MPEDGRWRPWILVAFTAVSTGISFGWLGVVTADKWRVGIALYILGRKHASRFTKDIEDQDRDRIIYSDMLSRSLDILDSCFPGTRAEPSRGAAEYTGGSRWV